VRGDDIVAGGLGPRGAVVWYSTDGESWRRGDLATTWGEEILDVAAGPRGFVAVGGEERHAGEAVYPLAWFSEDGQRWVRVPVDDSEAGSFWRVTAVGDGFASLANLGIDEPKVVFWHSADGRNWTAREQSTITEYEGVADLTVGPTGQLVVVGSSVPGDGPWTPTSWVSDDNGATWSVALAPGADEEDSGMSAVVGGPDLVAVGQMGSEATVWRSEDGSTWRQASEIPATTSTNRWSYLSAITRGENGYVAVGVDELGLAGVWLSDDGISWGHVSSPGLGGPIGRYEPSDVVTTASRTIVVGGFPNDDPSNTAWATVWLNPAPASPASSTPGSVTHSCPGGVVHVIDVVELTLAERLQCFGHRRLTLTGFVSNYGDSEGDRNYGRPRWLASPWCCSALLPIQGSALGRTVNLALHFDPGASFQSVLVTEPNARVRLTGHFDDRLARSCKPPPGESAASIVRRCREAFVVESARRAE
jgi:hypothetical protein